MADDREQSTDVMTDTNTEENASKQANVAENSDTDPEEILVGFKPVTKKRRRTVEESDAGDSDGEDQNTWQSTFQQFMETFMHMQHAMQRSPPQWDTQSNVSETVSELTLSVKPQPAQSNTESTVAQPSTSKGGTVSLAKHLEAVQSDEELGPPAHKDVAELVHKIWNKEVKEAKSLFNDVLRPSNVECLQKVDLDEEVLTALAKRQGAKDLDFAVRSIHHTMIRAAMAFTNMLSMIMTAEGKDISQQLADAAISGLKVLSFGSQLTHSFRKNQLRPHIHEDVKAKLCGRSGALEAINTTHLLFGGDIANKVKKGKD